MYYSPTESEQLYSQLWAKNKYVIKEANRIGLVYLKPSQATRSSLYSVHCTWWSTKLFLFLQVIHMIELLILSRIIPNFLKSFNMLVAYIKIWHWRRLRNPCVNFSRYKFCLHAMHTLSLSPRKVWEIDLVFETLIFWVWQGFIQKRIFVS